MRAVAATSFSVGAARAARARSANLRHTSRRAGPMAKRAVISARRRLAAAAQAASAGCNSASILARIAWPSTGATPAVLMPITTGERLTMVPNENVEMSGMSTILTGTPCSHAAAAKACASSPARAPIARVAPARSSARHSRSMMRMLPAGGDSRSASRSDEGAVVKTSTCAPAAATSSAFHTRPSPAPATTARRPLRSKKTGSTARAPMRAGRVSVGRISRITPTPPPWAGRAAPSRAAS